MKNNRKLVDLKIDGLYLFTPASKELSGFPGMSGAFILGGQTMRIPPLEIYVCGSPDNITIHSEDSKGEDSEITINIEQVDILIRWLDGWSKDFKGKYK